MSEVAAFGDDAFLTCRTRFINAAWSLPQRPRRARMMVESMVSEARLTGQSQSFRLKVR
jgi:hypothetical protein